MNMLSYNQYYMNIGDDLLYKACYSVPDTLACKHYKLVESGIFSHVNDFRVERCIGGINCAWACLNSEQPGGTPVGSFPYLLDITSFPYHAALLGMRLYCMHTVC